MKFNAVNKAAYGFYTSVKFPAVKQIEIEPLEVPFNDPNDWMYYSEAKRRFDFDDSAKTAKKFWKDYKRAVKGVAARYGVEATFEYEWHDEDLELELVEDDYVPPPPPTHYTKEEVLAAVQEALPNANNELIDSLRKAL